MLLNPVNMLFDYNESYKTGTPEAYETLLLDVMQETLHYLCVPTRLKQHGM